ncbi:MAG: LacI family transcriptional regulator [Alphaproteobacteria bacterium]|jgi:LacI family transcriptional regulator|nr:LacI family transcriptional regulator [Alphaproteobacteria bacterium]
MGRAFVRLKDIAEHTGFSVNTVSLALRDSPRIPQETRSAIQAAAQALNYLPNHIAQSLVSRETRTIGLVLTDLGNPTLTHVAQAIELRLAAKGYSTLFASSNNDRDAEAKAIEIFRSRQVDGMLIYSRGHRDLDHIRQLRRANYPLVLLVGDIDADIDVVCIDERAGAHKAVRHLIDLGHTSIGMLDGADRFGNAEKREGYLRALSEAGLTPAAIVDPGGFSSQHGYDAMSRLMAAPERVTAIFAVTDALALGALRWTQIKGLRVPQDVAIMGFDNIEFGQFAATPLSTINYEVEQVTTLAVDRLLVLIGSKDGLPPPIVTMIEPDLVVRESTEGRRG